MNTRQYCVWLKGVIDIMSADDPEFSFTPRQIELIKKNLDDVFTHELSDTAGEPTLVEDPYHGSPPPFQGPMKKPVMRC